MVSYTWMSLTKRSSTGLPATPNHCGRIPPEAIARHATHAWVMDSAEEREEVLAGAPEIPPPPPSPGPLVYGDQNLPLWHIHAPPPRNLPEVRAAVWKKLRH